jgi:hypothetical protein
MVRGGALPIKGTEGKGVRGLHHMEKLLRVERGSKGLTSGGELSRMVMKALFTQR